MEKLGLLSMEWKRLTGNMLEIYKMMGNIDRVECRKLSEVNNTRGHRFSVRGKTFSEYLKQIFSTQKVQRS